MIGGIFTMFDISASGMRAERARMNVTANNLANINTTHDENGNVAPYRRKRIFFKPGAPAITGSHTLGVSVDKIDEDKTTDFIKKHEPGHPDADEKGYVSYPNIQVPMEMVDMMMASRAFQANVTSFETAKQIFSGALQIIA